MARLIGDWRLKKTLGHGSFGEVKYAVNSKTGEQAAVKICVKQALDSKRGREQLQREIANMKALKHPNVLALYEVFETPHNFYLVMELASGGELFDLIQDHKRFPDTMARKYFQELILGLRYCHKQGIVHRDLKPQNLLLTSNDVLKIADFGFSNLQYIDEEGKVTPSLRLQTRCGTPNYAAPEIFLGKGYDGFKTDIWACGVILYVMLCGHVPFRPHGAKNNIEGVIISIVEGRYTIPASLSPESSDLIRRILVKDPEQRITVEGIINHVWFTEGFDSSRTEIPKIVVTDEAVRASINLSAERTITAEEDDRLNVPEPPPSPIDVPEAVDLPEAFDPVSPGASPGSPPKLDRNEVEAWLKNPCPTLDQLGRASQSGVASSIASAVSTSAQRKQSMKGVAPQTLHTFQRKHWNSPHWCYICRKFIYGVGRQGFECLKCKCPVHVKCVDVATSQSTCEAFLASEGPVRKRVSSATSS